MAYTTHTVFTAPNFLKGFCGCIPSCTRNCTTDDGGGDSGDRCCSARFIAKRY